MTNSEVRAFVRRIAFRAAPAIAIAAAAAATPVNAQTVDLARKNHCARLGEGFVAVAGSDGCMRIGGHVRVDITKTPTASAMGYAAMAPDGVRPASDRGAHVRAGADVYPR
jgi:hypothetical protein